jgi:hypothetical protein
MQCSECATRIKYRQWNSHAHGISINHVYSAPIIYGYLITFKLQNFSFAVIRHVVTSRSALTTRNTVLPQKLTGPQPVIKLLAYFGTRMFITAFTIDGRSQQTLQTLTKVKFFTPVLILSHGHCYALR